MNKTKRLKIQTISLLSKAIGEFVTGSQISEVFKILRLSDTSKESTKWRRLDFVFKKYQIKNSNSKDIFRVIESLFSPVGYIDNQIKFNSALCEINKILITEGFEISHEGKVITSKKVESLDEINQRYNSLLQQLTLRGVHPEILKYCTKELLDKNYFHSVFEAAKGLCDRVRILSGILEDGSALFDKVFSIKNPILKYNDLSNDSQKNQQNGLKEMLHGITHYIRNVTAHEPKIKWIVEEKEAVDILMILSFLHSALDVCIKV